MLSFSLFMLACFTTLILTVFNPSYIKTNLSANNTYKNIVPATLELATTATSNNTSSQLSPKIVAEISPIVSSALTPQFLKATTESIIDGTFAWLKDEAAMPDFDIETANIKSTLQSSMATYLQNRISNLPTCPNEPPSGSFGPLTAICKPSAALDATNISKSAAADFTNSIPLLEQPALSVKSLGLEQNFTTDSPVQNIPTIYKLIKVLPVVFAVLALASGVTLILLSTHKYRAWRSIGHTFVIAGVFLIAVGALTIFLNSHFTTRFFGSASVQQLSFVNTVFTPILQTLSNSLAYFALYFGVGYAVIGAGCYIIAHRMQLNHPDIIDEPPGSKDSTTQPTPITPNNQIQQQTTIVAQ